MSLIGRRCNFFFSMSIVLGKKARMHFHDPCSFISPKFQHTILVFLLSLFFFFLLNYCFPKVSFGFGAY